MEIGIKSLEKFIAVVMEFFVNYSLQVFGAFIILVIGFIIARWVSNFVLRCCEKKQVDITLSKFIGDLAKILIIVFVAIICLGKFGITVTPFIATLGAVTLGISLALQGLFSNYAAGLLIILTRPFVVGNTIALKDTTGIVQEVKLPATILSTEDGERITIPNKHFIGEILYNSFSFKIVETVVGISYGDDPEVAIDLIGNVLKNYTEIPQEPNPQIGIQEFADSAISIGVRYWVPTNKYYHLQYQVNLSIYKALKEGKITIPFPQRDVHLISNEKIAT